MSKIRTNNQVLLEECINQEFEESGAYTDIDVFFEYFSADQILKHKNLNSDEIEDGQIGGANDGGFDGLYVFLNDELLTQDKLESLTPSKGKVIEFYIIQAKHTFSFDENVILKWKNSSSILFQMSELTTSQKKRFNEKVIEKFSIFKDVIKKFIRYQLKIEIKFFYTSLANDLHPNVQNQAQELEDMVKKQFPSSDVTISFLNAEKLLSSFHSEIDSVYSINLSSPPISSWNRNDYIALMNLREYYHFISNEKGDINYNLFEDNVRDYQGKNSVNSCIGETLKNKKDVNFWWLNNGVTILAEKVTPITNTCISLEAPKIVNGLQTSTEIFKNFMESESEDEKREILIRIIQPTDEPIRDSIIFSTNNQTAIPKSSLRVTDKIHYQIEMYLKNRGIYYDRRKNFYKNQKKNSQDIISVSFLAQCLISIVLKKPDMARARPSTLLVEEDIYNSLYREDVSLNVYYNVAQMGLKVKRFLNHCQGINTIQKSDILFYVIYATASKVLNKTNITLNDMKNINIDVVDDAFLTELVHIVLDKYNQSGGTSQIAKSPKFVLDIDEIMATKQR